MTATTLLIWQDKRTDETRQVEEVLRKGGFPTVDAYRSTIAWHCWEPRSGTSGRA